MALPVACMPTKEFLKRSKAAKKGWRTRRRNNPELAKLHRSKSAKKGVRTKREKAKSTQTLWRITVGANYYIRGRKREDSPNSASYMVRGWFRTRSESVSSEQEFIELSEAGREEVLDTKVRAYSLDEEPNIEILEVPYDETLINQIEETDEE